VTIHELKQKVVELHTEANAMKTLAEKSQMESAELKEKVGKESTELHSKVEILTRELSEKTKLVETQKEQLVNCVLLESFLLSFSLRLKSQPASPRKTKLSPSSGTSISLSLLTFSSPSPSLSLPSLQ
jgi:hypothetical protein